MLTCVARPVLANQDPTLDWWTYETPHFRLHHPSTARAAASKIASLAEEVHETLTEALATQPSQRTEIVLTDDTDDANGSATALPYNQIRLYVTAPDDLSPLGDYDDWYRGLLVHEYTHILQMDDISGVPRALNALLGKTFSPNQAQPRWVLEGLAVLSESRHTSAGRLRSSLYDMYLRADVLDDRIARLDQISNAPLRWPQGNLWYLYGSRFLAWISAIYGPDTLRAVSREYGSNLLPWQLNRAMLHATGRTYEQLYAGFVDHLKRRTEQEVAEVDARGRREGVRLTHRGFQATYPRFLPASAADSADPTTLLYQRDDGHARSGLYALEVPSRAELERGQAPPAAPERLVARTVGRTVVSFTPEGDLIFNSVSPWKNVYSRNDLWRLPRAERSTFGEEDARQRLTDGLRAEAPDVSPDGRQVVFTVNAGGTTSLMLAELATRDGGLGPPRTLVASLPFEQVYTPRFSPDGRSVAYSAWSSGGYRDLRVVDLASGQVRQLQQDRAQDLQPTWAPDGRSLYFASDRSGRFNVHVLDLVSGKSHQVTNVRTGAVCPALSPDGKTLVYVGYTSRGWDLYALPLEPSRFLEDAGLASPEQRPDAPITRVAPPQSLHPYEPWSTLRPRQYSASYLPGSYGANALQVRTTGEDAAARHAFAAQLVADPSAPQPQGSVRYTYGRLPVDLGLSAYHVVAPRQGYRISDALPRYDEVSDGLSLSISAPLQGPFSNQAVALSYGMGRARAHLPTSLPAPDPAASITVRPVEGRYAPLRLYYGYSNVEGSAFTAGPARGLRLSLGLDYADRATGSELDLMTLSGTAQAYVPTLWPRYGTLALRLSGAAAEGSYSRDGFFGVGGYNLDDRSLLDEVLDGSLNGAFVLRGYRPGAFIGRSYGLFNAEWRLPFGWIDAGPSTLPIYARRLDAALFLDWGGAFQRLEPRAFRILRDGALLHSPDLHLALGGELWLNVGLGYWMTTQLRLGWAAGLDPQAIPGGQLYFVAASAY